MRSGTERSIFNNHGQALVENILIVPLIVVIIVMIFWFARLLLTKQQLIMAARYGTDLIAYSTMDEDGVRREVKDYLCGEDAEGRRLDPSKLSDKNIKVNIERCEKVTVTNVFKPMSFTPSTVEIYYDFETPKLFSAWSGYIGGDGLAAKLRISARSEVLAGTGCEGDNYR